MISGPLFKQSYKANWLMWLLVTSATCIMLSTIILVMGNPTINEMKTSMMEMFTSDSIDSQIKKSAMNYYSMTETALSSYEDTVLNVTAIANAYEQLLNSGYTNEMAIATLTMNLPNDQEKSFVITIANLCASNGNTLTNSQISAFVLDEISKNVYEKVLLEYNLETADQAKTIINNAITSYLTTQNVSTSDFATGYISTILSEQMFEQLAQVDGVNYSKEDIYNISYGAIQNFRAQLVINPNLNVENLISDLTSSLLDKLPTAVSTSLIEIKDMNIYGLVVGTIFYRIAGLLLPIVFTIMTANSLLAGQVDSGSLAYVLSTPIKRRKVTLTQMTFLVSSLLAMFILTTIASLVAISFVDKSIAQINTSQLIMLNVGAFFTMFAIAGICFLASAYFNRSKNALAVGGGLSISFLVFTILGLFGSKVIPSFIRINSMNMFNFVSIISLFDSLSILNGTADYLWKFGILAFIGIVTFAAGILWFDRKDLPL